MQDSLYEYFINPNTSSAIISSGWVDKRLNRLDQNLSDIRTWGGLSVNLSGVTTSISNLRRLVVDESEKTREYVTTGYNVINSHIDIAKWEINDKIESIEIPETDISDITEGIGNLKQRFTKLSDWIKRKEDKEKSEELNEKEGEYSEIVESIEHEYKTLLSSKESEIEALKKELEDEKKKEEWYEAMVQVLEEEINETKEKTEEETKDKFLKTLETL